VCAGADVPSAPAKLCTTPVFHGDTCEGIAEREGLSLEEIVRKNPYLNAECTNLPFGQVVYNLALASFVDLVDQTIKQRRRGSLLITR
jgi:hypothetical protein